MGGLTTCLYPTIICQGFMPSYSTKAPLLWLSMFSLSEVFIEKREDGDNYACAETTVKKAQDRLKCIQKAIKGNGYLEAIFVPLEFFQATLFNSNKKDPVGFSLEDFQGDEDNWSPSYAMSYLKNLEDIIEAFDIIIGGDPLTKAFKLFNNNSYLFNGSIEKDRKALKKEMVGWKLVANTTLHESAFNYLMGGPDESSPPQEKEAEKLYYSWIEQHKSIWEEDTKEKIRGKRKANLNEAEKESETPDEETKESPVEVKKLPIAKKIKDGLVKQYDKHGKLASELNYKDGQLHGLCKYYNNGKLERELHYKNGKRNGLCKYWEDGYIRSISNFRNDRLNGIDKYFEYETKELLEENIFKNGKVVKKLKAETS